MYTGYGYWEFELDDDDKAELGMESFSTKEQHVQSYELELPDFAEKEIELLGKTTVDHLLIPNDITGTSLFYFCEDEPEYSKEGWSIGHKLKKITITADEVFSKEKWESYLKSKNVINSNLDNERVSTPSSKYETRDIDFRKWIDETKPDLKNMTKAAIQQALRARNSSLWTSGFPDWWKRQTIHKGTAGRKKKVIK
jgi:hypothetical protein